MKATVVSSSAIHEHNRMDAAFHLACAEFEDEAVELLQNYAPCDLRKIAKEIPRNSQAERIFKGSTFLSSSIDRASPFEVALYLAASNWKEGLTAMKKQAMAQANWCDTFLNPTGQKEG